MNPKKNLAADTTAGAKSILLIDDHPVVRAGIKQTLEQSGFRVCGELESATGAISVVKELHPDLVLLDISLGQGHGINLIEQLRELFPQLPVLVLSMHDEATYAPRAIRAGAHGYVSKQERPERLLAALHQVLAGGVYISDAVAKRMLQTLTVTQGEPLSLPAEILSERELQIFEMLGRGFGSREIAGCLQVSFKTVNSHREHIKAKLHIKSGQELVRQAIQWTQLESAAGDNSQDRAAAADKPKLPSEGSSQ